MQDLRMFSLQGKIFRLSHAMEVLETLVLAPAKVNLCLHVLERRPDGYHSLDSLMVPISLYDELLLRVHPSDASSPVSSPGATLTVGSNATDVPSGSANLAHHAATLFLTTIRKVVAVEIQIRKRIPPGSGLGGGSSDAAATLLALNRLFGRPLRTKDLAGLAAQIGADVPFFVYGRPAHVGGLGDQITPVALRSPISLVVCSDGYVLSTGLVYSQLQLSLTRYRSASNITDFVSGRKPISDLLMNDLEAAAAQVHPKVLSLKAKLVEQGALGALMTGSGSAVFGVWPDPQLARSAAARLREAGLWAEAVQTLDMSPAVVG